MTMNTAKILSALCLAILQLTMQAQKYRLAWEENFSGKEINDEYWSKIPRGSSDWNRHMSYHESLYDVRKGKLVLYGKRTFTYPKIETDKKGQYPFGTPFYLLIDMQVEGSWVGKADPKDYPVKMEIDWVKFHELIQ